MITWRIERKKKKNDKILRQKKGKRQMFHGVC